MPVSERLGKIKPKNTAINTNIPMVKNEIIGKQNVECQTQFNYQCFDLESSVACNDEMQVDHSLMEHYAVSRS